MSAINWQQEAIDNARRAWSEMNHRATSGPAEDRTIYKAAAVEQRDKLVGLLVDRKATRMAYVLVQEEGKPNRWEWRKLDDLTPPTREQLTKAVRLELGLDPDGWELEPAELLSENYEGEYSI